MEGRRGEEGEGKGRAGRGKGEGKVGREGKGSYRYFCFKMRDCQARAGLY